SMQPIGKAALIASVGGRRAFADWTNPDHRLRRLLAEFIGMAGLTFILSGCAAILARYGGPPPPPRPNLPGPAPGPAPRPAGGGRFLPWRYLGPFQPGHDAGVRAAARHGLGDGGLLLDCPVRGRRLWVAAGPCVLRPGREPGRHHAQARPVLAGRRVRGDHHL